MRQRFSGFTLLELLVVVAFIAVGTVGVGLALRDSEQAALEAQAQALAALLESGRAQSRATGVPVRWKPVPSGFEWVGLDNSGPDALPTTWRTEGIQAQVAAPLLLGPEPLIGAQSVQLWRTEQPQQRITVATNGVGPFAIVYNESKP